MDELKSQLVTAIRLLTAEGLMDFNGHLSYRLPGTDRVLINSRRASRAALGPADIVTMDLDGRLVEGDAEPPSERTIHTRIYAARPDVYSVAHLHPQVSTVFSIAGRPLVPVFTAGCIFPREGVPVYDDPGLIHSTQAGDAVAHALGAERAVLLRGHGAVTVGEDIMTCFNVSIWLEENAKKQLAASSLGNPRVLTEDECTRLRSQMWKPEVIRKTWDFFTERGHTTGILESDLKVQEEGP
ncbi:MAG: class II aldolase/adducin family protein [Acidobacteriota bacterium]